MDPKHYIMLNGIIVILLISSILFLRRGGEGPPRLDLRKSTNRTPKPIENEGAAEPFTQGSEGARSLNVVFQYEGDWYDAFEILGIPAGTPLEQARAKFNELLKSVSPDRMGIIKEAIKAIATGDTK